MELRQLRQFVAVAEARSFTLAAAGLRMSQPALSQSIQRLERELECTLFQRNKQNPGAGLLLTPAGASLYADSRGLIVAARRAEQRARRAGHRLQTPPVALGFSSSTPQQLIARALESVPGRAEVVPVQLDWGHEHEAITSGRVDLAYLQFPEGASFPGHEVSEIERVPRVAVLAAAHPLAARREVTLAELDEEPILDPGFLEGPAGFRDFWLALPRDEGRIGRIVGPPARTVEEMCTFVSAGRGMAIASGVLAAQYHRADVVFLPIAGLAPIVVGVARLVGDERVEVMALFDRLASPRQAG